MSATDALMHHNTTLPAVSGTWIYSPGRDADPGWTAAYTGTPDIVNSVDREGKGYMYFRTQTANGTKVALDFTGVKLYLCIVTNGAKYQFAINGTAVELSSSRFNAPECSAMGAPTTLYSDILTQGAHRAELTVLEASPSAEMQLYGAVVTSELRVPAKPSAVYADWNVDDLNYKWASIDQVWRDTKWITTADEPLAYQKTLTTNCNYGIDEANSISFTGANAAVLWGFLDQDTHYYSVQLNDVVFNGDASTSMWRAGSAPIFVQWGLDPTRNYTLTYRNFNENFPDCRSSSSGLTRTCCATIDRLQLWGSPSNLKEGSIQPGSSFTRVSTSQSSEQTVGPTSEPLSTGSSSSSSSVVVIIAGVLAGVVFICVIALLLCWRWNRRKRRTPGLGRPIPLAGEDPAVSGDALQPWLDSMQEYITAFHAPATTIQGSSQGEKPLEWTTKPLPPPPGETSSRTETSPSVSNRAHSALSGPPLRAADMRLILAYVAARMDPPPTSRKWTIICSTFLPVTRPSYIDLIVFYYQFVYYAFVYQLARLGPSRSKLFYASPPFV